MTINTVNRSFSAWQRAQNLLHYPDKTAIQEFELATSRELINLVRSEGRTLLTEVEAKELLKQPGIPVVDTRLAISRDEAISITKEIGFPVVLKIVAPDIIHKSDAGGVMLNLEHRSN